MGRPRSCLQIIACGCDSKDGDDIDLLQESKNSRDKRGWSFRKRSSQQHRVLNNTVIAEISPVTKKNLETATIDFQSSANCTVSEKPTIIHFTNEAAHVPKIESPKGSEKVDVASENGSKVDSMVEETNVVVIQAGIRGILAQRELLKVKNVVKLQAAVRGFLVRRHAVGTLRCAQAIVKMQAIVRARRAHLSLERSAQDELYEKNENENHDSNIAEKGVMTKSNAKYIPIEKLLTNSFARQLLESTPRSKSINIKCVPSKKDSAWKWLERWLAVASLDVLEPDKEVSVTDQMERETKEPKKDVSVTKKMEKEIEEPEKEVSVAIQTERETEEPEKLVSVPELMERETEELESEKEVSVTKQMERETEEPEEEVSVTEKMKRKPEELEKEVSVTEQMERETKEPEKEVLATEQMERETEEPEKEVLVTEQMERETEEPEKDVFVIEQVERETEGLEKEVSVTEQMERETEEPKKEESDTEKMLREIEESHVEDKVESKALSETEDLNSSTVKSVSPSESEDLITYDASNLQSQTCHSPSLSVEDNLEQPEPVNARSSEVKETTTKVSSVQDQKIQFDVAGLQTESSSSSDNLQMDMEQVNPRKRLAPKQLENEGKKFVYGSRKVSNPSFINAQAKFEQLSSAPGSIGTISSVHQDDGIKLHSEAVSSPKDMVLTTTEPSADENIILSESRIIQIGGSECGTELSISSTINSPDRFEAGLADTHANDVSKKEVHDSSSDLSTKVVVNSSTTIQIDVQLLVNQPEESNKSNGLFITSVCVVDTAPSESKLESSSDQQIEHDVGHDHQTYRSSPEVSPRRRLTVPESQGTPSSQVSVKAKWDKTTKTVSYQKQKSSSAEKKSPSSLNRNSASRSTENSYKDQKTGKRNSLDSARQENVEKELKESSSSNSLPRFMQATQSARAKLHSTNSPRSSPDFQDRELYMKKRHSFPAEGRLGSPHIQQGAKGNEKTWRR